MISPQSDSCSSERRRPCSCGRCGPASMPTRVRFAALGANQHDLVRHASGISLLDDAALLALLPGLGVAGCNIDALDDHLVVSAGMATRTLPLLPLSLPDRTTTVSLFFNIHIWYPSINTVSGAREQDLHVVLITKLSRPPAQRYGYLSGCLSSLMMNRCVLVKTDVGAVGAADALLRCGR